MGKVSNLDRVSQCQTRNAQDAFLKKFPIFSGKTQENFSYICRDLKYKSSNQLSNYQVKKKRIRIGLEREVPILLCNNTEGKYSFYFITELERT